MFWKPKADLPDFKGRAMLNHPAFFDNKEAFPFHSSKEYVAFHNYPIFALKLRSF